MIDALAKGALMKKNENEAYELLEDMAANLYMWSNERSTTPKKVIRIKKMDIIARLTIQVALLTQQMQKKKKKQQVQVVQTHPPI